MMLISVATIPVPAGCKIGQGSSTRHYEVGDKMGDMECIGNNQWITRDDHFGKGGYGHGGYGNGGRAHRRYPSGIIIPRSLNK